MMFSFMTVVIDVCAVHATSGGKAVRLGLSVALATSLGELAEMEPGQDASVFYGRWRRERHGGFRVTAD
jgi:hypothetical protein